MAFRRTRVFEFGGDVGPDARRIFKETLRGAKNRRHQQRLRSCLHSAGFAPIEFEKDEALQSLRHTGRIYWLASWIAAANFSVE